MPWKATEPMTERVQCRAADLRHRYALTELCARCGSRRPTGDNWVHRDANDGAVGLPEKSRAPPRCPHRMAEEVEAARLEAKRAHPPGGPRQLLPYLRPRRPALELPAPSTAGELFRAAG
jgi:putative transposase